VLGQTLRFQTPQRAGIDLRGMELVYRRAERLPQPHRLARIDRLTMRRAHLLHQPREDHLPVHRKDRGRDLRSCADGIERIA
jgi:hypothetical protein